MSEPVEEKKLVINHVFKNFVNSENYELYWSPSMNHFNVPWKIGFEVALGNVNFFLKCVKFRGKDEWSIDTDIELKFITETKIKGEIYYSNSKDPQCYLGTIDLLDISKHLVDGNLPIEVHVTIKKMTGIQEENLKNFDDELAKKYSDTVLIVKDKKFHVSKLFLASHSTYFQSLLFGKFEELEKSEIELKDVDPSHFQNYLELIHGVSVVNDETVIGLFHLADFFDSKTVTSRCEEFLINGSKRSLTEKFSLAIEYKIDELKKKCVSDINNRNEIRPVIDKISSHVEDSIWKDLLMKALNIP